MRLGPLSGLWLDFVLELSWEAKCENLSFLQIVTAVYWQFIIPVCFKALTLAEKGSRKITDRETGLSISVPQVRHSLADREQ